MFDRIIQNIPETDGSTTLPSILQFTKEIAYRESQYSAGNNTVNNMAMNRKYTAGTIGDNQSEFSIEFCGDVNNLPVNIKWLYDIVKNAKSYITLDTKTLSSKFRIFQFDDSSYRAMSLRGYDFTIKVFNSNNDKLNSNYVAVIKSYTLRKAWCLIEKSVADPSYYIIDFGYNLFKEEKTSNSNITTKFLSLNPEANIQNLFANAQTASPYLDKYFINENSSVKSSVNTQKNMFAYQIAEIKNIDLLKETKTATFGSMTARNYNSSNNILYNKKIIYTNPEKYIKSAAYEVYGYSASSPYGARCLMELHKYATYEIFPIMSDMIHYIFEYTGDGTPNVATVQKVLKYNKLYLFDYNFSYLYIFTENNTKEDNTNYLATFVEVYIPMQYGEYSAVQIGTDTTDYSKWTPVDLSNDIRSDYDLTKFGQNAEINDNSYFIPYNGNDVNTQKVLELYSSTDKPIQFYSAVIENFDKFLYDPKENTYFDILGYSANSDTSTSNIINSETIIATLKAAGFRKEETDEEDATEEETEETPKAEFVEDFETCVDTLNKNLFALCDTTIEKDQANNISTTNQTEYFYILIEYTGEYNYLDSIMEYEIGTNSYYFNKKILSVKLAEDGKRYCIIPYDETLKTISFKNAIKYAFVR